MIIAGRNDAAGSAADAAAVLPEVKTSSGRSKSLLSMYAEPPSGEIKMEDFETFAIDRLCVLKTIEEQKAKGTKPDGMAAKVKEVESKYIGSTATLSRKVLAEKDRISHYALRLAYCKTDDQRRWYVTHEAALFRHRFEEASQQAKNQFLHDNNIQVTMVRKSDVSDEVRLALEEMEAGQFRAFSADGERLSSTGLYLKVPFEDVIESVKRRKAYICGGDAYVPSSELLTFVEPRFKMNLSRELTRSSKIIHLVEQDTRLVPLLHHLREQYLAFGDFKTEGTGITGTLNLGNLEQAYKQAFPPCMMQMRERLKSHKHLKYEGRKQLGAFLKRAGLSMVRIPSSAFRLVDGWGRRTLWQLRHSVLRRELPIYEWYSPL
jgi:DNA primase large subunit